MKLRAGHLVVLWSIFGLAAANLLTNKLRTLLTLVGIIVGVASMITVVTIIKGLNQTVASTFSSNGSTVFTLSKIPSVITSREEFLKVNKRKDITREDAEAVIRGCPACASVGWWMRGAEVAKHGDNSADNVLVRGATASIFDIEGLSIDAGRKWTGAEDAAGSNVAVIGADIVKNVFNNAPPEQVLGSDVRIRGGVCRVIGIVAAQGTIFGASRDNFVMVPYETALRILPIKESLIVDIQVADADRMETAKDQVTTIMRTRRGKIVTVIGEEREEDEGFTVESADVFIGLYQTATDNIYLVTIGVSAISLVVGGIVVMNIMLVSVAERTKEIGLRMAIGARRRDVLTQFLTEAVLIASLGGMIGVFCGFGVANLISLAIGFPTLISLWSIILGVAVSSVIGILSGSYPAWRASRLDPVEAMRKE
ncbi:MAG: ABC transporter permease [Acidobacteria bacterium]|nr:ABC transporter permease [Acidobacteriota bacterium]